MVIENDEIPKWKVYDGSKWVLALTYTKGWNESSSLAFIAIEFKWRLELWLISSNLKPLIMKRKKINKAPTKYCYGEFRITLEI